MNDSNSREPAETWRHFAIWREKLFGGFLAVLAALGVAFFRTDLPTWRFVICLAAVVVGVAFWLLDLRTGQLINVSQRAAAEQGSGKDSFAALQKARFEQSSPWITYGLGVDLLIGGILAGSFAGAYHYWTRLPESALGVTPAIALVVILVFLVVSQCVRRVLFNQEKQGLQKQTK